MQIYALMPNLSSPCWARLVSMGKSVCRPRHRCGKLHCPCTAQPSTFESSSLCSAPKPAVAGTVLHTGMACSGGVQESQAHAACRDGRNRPARSLHPAPGQAGRHGSPIPPCGKHAHMLTGAFPSLCRRKRWMGTGLQLDCNCMRSSARASPARRIPAAGTGTGRPHSFKHSLKCRLNAPSPA